MAGCSLLKVSLNVNGSVAKRISKCAFVAATQYHGVPLVKVLGFILISTEVIGALQRAAIFAAPRLNFSCSPGVVRVPSGKIIRLFPAARDA